MISVKSKETLKNASWIRKMFEEGAMLKAEHGAENVFDFSLGNPNVPPPDAFGDRLINLAKNQKPGDHAYMPNTGFPSTREAVARFVSGEQGVSLCGRDVIMTCGAAGALNVIFKALLDPGDEVMVPAPYFVEYGFYAENHGGVLVTVPTKDDFSLDIDAIARAVTSKTKVVLINSPNNPSGQVYSKESLLQLGDLLRQMSAKIGRTIYLVSDEPYRKIIFDGLTVPPLFPVYPDSILATSYSKDLSIPGERIGFLAVNPEAAYKEELLAAMALTNRTLGYVNAPAFMQRVVESLQGACVDIKIYEAKRDLLCDGLAACGYEFVRPKGAFYLFPKSPVPDDVTFVKALQEARILTVPGRGFGSPGFFRIAFCVDDQTIKRAMPGFERVRKKLAP